MVSPVHNLEKWEKRYQCNTLKKGRISLQLFMRLMCKNGKHVVYPYNGRQEKPHSDFFIFYESYLIMRSKEPCQFYHRLLNLCINFQFSRMIQCCLVGCIKIYLAFITYFQETAENIIYG